MLTINTKAIVGRVGSIGLVRGMGLVRQVGRVGLVRGLRRLGQVRRVGQGENCEF
ncbi:hypothetical protein [Capnocytophaga leadbetteri]|uniref:hypothetical protein n=1 Tax=Capnocytophaga leadbetteri TaxID=327575 RepID=UPI0026EC9EEB|nr:hypothetical protein [Capnocytophaga leadbetteri]